jgi:lipoyl(octanoyl) transferase
VNSSSSFLCDENLPIQIYNAISLGRLNYTKSWAWQQTLLSKRLAHRRTRSSSQPDTDCLLLLEHAPVYTLGRGSDESHILVLDSDQRQPLSRQGGSARLTIDRQADSLAHKLPLSQAIHHLSNLATPVYAPNGVPIYRVERGGEVTFHGPSQLVVYPLLDLTCSPFQKDLHWYLRQVEQVVIETLSHYNIHGQRDDENTGTKFE